MPTLVDAGVVAAQRMEFHVKCGCFASEMTVQKPCWSELRARRLPVKSLTVKGRGPVFMGPARGTIAPVASSSAQLSDNWEETRMFPLGTTATPTGFWKPVVG